MVVFHGPAIFLNIFDMKGPNLLVLNGCVHVDETEAN